MLKKKGQMKASKATKKRTQSFEDAELLEAIRIGLQQSKNGQVVSLEQVKKRFKKWLE